MYKMPLVMIVFFIAPTHTWDWWYSFIHGIGGIASYVGWDWWYSFIRGIGGIASLIFKTGIRRRRKEKSTPRPLLPRHNACRAHWIAYCTGPRIGLDVPGEKEISCLSRESDYDPSIIHPVAQSQYWPKYPGSLTLRRLMSYIYGAPILDVSRSHTTTQHSR